MIAPRLIWPRRFQRAATDSARGAPGLRLGLPAGHDLPGGHGLASPRGGVGVLGWVGLVLVTALVGGCASAAERVVPAELAASAPTASQPPSPPSSSPQSAPTGASSSPSANTGAGRAVGTVIGWPVSPAEMDGTMSASAADPRAATTGTIASPPATNTPDMTRAQQLLLTQGFDVGPIDGSAGPATMAAISAFQAKIARPVTGQLDGETFKALLDAAVEVADQLPVSVTVDLSDQRVLVYNALGQLITYWPVSTGGPGNETPTGTFAVDSRQLVGTASSDYRVHMDFFTVFNGGIGFHGIPWVSNRDNRLWTPLGEYGVSHGCIRMEDANAEYLYSFLPDGAPVVVQD